MIDPLVENESNQVLGKLTCFDPNKSDVHEIMLIKENIINLSADNDKFAVDSEDNLVMTAIYNSKTQNLFSILVRCKDVGGMVFDRSFKIPGGEKLLPAVDVIFHRNPEAIIEGQDGVGKEIGYFETIDSNPGQTHTYEFIKTDMNDHDDFFIMQCATCNIVRTIQIIESAKSVFWTLTVRVTDSGGSTFDKNVTINNFAGDNQPYDIAYIGGVHPLLSLGMVIINDVIDDNDWNRKLLDLVRDKDGKVVYNCTKEGFYDIINNEPMN